MSQDKRDVDLAVLGISPALTSCGMLLLLLVTFLLLKGLVGRLLWQTRPQGLGQPPSSQEGSIVTADLLTLRLFVNCSNRSVLMCITMGETNQPTSFSLFDHSVAYALVYSYCLSTEYMKTAHRTCAGSWSHWVTLKIFKQHFGSSFLYPWLSMTHLFCKILYYMHAKSLSFHIYKSLSFLLA